jgi:hypothetical protein
VAHLAQWMSDGQPIILPASPIFLRDRAAIAQALPHSLDRGIPGEH